MPQADKDLADRIIARFGSIDDAGPTRFLQEAGYGFRGDFLWEPKPGVTSNDDMTQDEWECLLFLVQEWDYGGLVGPEDPPCPVLPIATKDTSALAESEAPAFPSRKDAPADAFGPYRPEQLGMTEEEIVEALNAAREPEMG